MAAAAAAAAAAGGRRRRNSKRTRSSPSQTKAAATMTEGGGRDGGERERGERKEKEGMCTTLFAVGGPNITLFAGRRVSGTNQSTLSLHPCFPFSILQKCILDDSKSSWKVKEKKCVPCFSAVSLVAGRYWLYVVSENKKK